MRLLVFFITHNLLSIATGSSDLSKIDDEKEAEIRSTTNQILHVIEQEIKKSISGGNKHLSKRMGQAYPDILNQYYPRAYNILRAACAGNNPSLYRPAPGGGYYRPISKTFYKRQESIDYTVNGVDENAKEIQKQLAVVWEDNISQNKDNSVSRRALPNFSGQIKGANPIDDLGEVLIGKLNQEPQIPAPASNSPSSRTNEIPGSDHNLSPKASADKSIKSTSSNWLVLKTLTIFILSSVAILFILKALMGLMESTYPSGGRYPGYPPSGGRYPGYPPSGGHYPGYPPSGGHYPEYPPSGGTYPGFVSYG
jgi:hypothetical protein